MAITDCWVSDTRRSSKSLELNTEVDDLVVNIYLVEMTFDIDVEKLFVFHSIFNKKIQYLLSEDWNSQSLDLC